jgi:hypothetical protein
MITTEEAAKILHSGKCFCGREKQPGTALCSHCLFALPEHMRNTLDYREHSNFSRNYRAARNYLDVHFASLNRFRKQ